MRGSKAKPDRGAERPEFRMACGKREMRKLDLRSRITNEIREGHGFSRAEQRLDRAGFSR